jgi:glycosyltransferase involved in cell wall biosynthesis
MAFVSISTAQWSPVPDLRSIQTVHHGLPLGLLQPNFGPGEYLAFLGRVSPEKGPHVAIKWARSTEIPLRIAAKIPGDQGEFFKKRIAPFLDEKKVKFVGEVNDQAIQMTKRRIPCQISTVPTRV